ncbi:Lipoprotein-anchoring transpeptidase ErfK/SrfK [Asanoa ishikariensis]|uniref:Lipoprotein-anchoring transpeptidase ErfK/SrfK n=2 Tax=Asanoa ishikariensis TaxID=137265 RepID=A0A1H3LIF1_9ACTN|nr:L,D-transpeptidase family protein [Asanoa ishikariensis]SDY63724.1 Lipoprotein-anchoring transpeptidase ErfK/SrfK [Asanoa ishikariensis]
MHGVRGTTMRLVAVAVVTVVGAGACTFAPSQSSASGAGPVPVSATVGTGASGPPEPTANPSTVAPKPDKTPQKPKVKPKPKPAGCPTGERQRDVEAALSDLGSFGTITIDGKQSAQDCQAIKRFQRRFGISPAEGRAGPTTASVAKRLANTDPRKCEAGKGLTFCVDLTNQTVLAIRGGKVILGPTVTRTGMSGGFQTPAGNYKVNFRNVKEWSDPYEVWLPYWQHFVDGMGFHETTTYIHNGAIGSHGCVNLLPADARKLWSLGKVGTPVHVYGRRPGT